MLLNNEVFHPDDYDAVIHPVKQKSLPFTVENVLQFLREQGADENALHLLKQQYKIS